MKKALLIPILISSLCSIAHAAEGQFISMQTQYFEMNTPTPIALQPVTCSLNDMAWDETKKVLLIQEDGVYEFVTITQYGIKETATECGDMYYWLEVNGKPLLETLQLVSVPLQTATKLKRFDTTLTMKAGSKVRVMFSSTSPDIGVLSFAPTQTTPFIASVSMTVFKTGNIVTYY